MEFRDLKIFMTVAKTSSVTKAADQLGYVQSNITARIQHLENQLRTTLFHRHSRGVVLTSSGETMLHYAEQIINLYTEAEQAVQNTETPIGPFRIGAIELITATRLPDILTGYHQQFPYVELSLITGPTNELIESVLNYSIEAAFVAGPVKHPLLCESYVIEEELVLVSKSENIDLQATSNLTILVFREGCAYRKRLEHFLDHLGVKSYKMIELGTLDGILGCVNAGLGISLVPRNFIEQGRYKVAIHEIPTIFSNASTVLIYRNDRFLSPALDKFIQIMHQF